MGVLRPDLIVKSMSPSTPSPALARTLHSNDGDVDIVPIVMAGIIGIYGLVVSVLIANELGQKTPLYTGFIQLGAGLAVGLAGMAAGYVPPRLLP